LFIFQVQTLPAQLFEQQCELEEHVSPATLQQCPSWQTETWIPVVES
jgi:hypothetical protein